MNLTGRGSARSGTFVAALSEGAVVLKLARRRTVVSHYPFLQFLSVIVIPTIYWIGIVEVGVLGSQDVVWSLTFGQVSSTSFQLACCWCDPNLFAPLGPRCVHGRTSNHRSEPLSSQAVALVHQLDLGSIHHSAPGSRNTRPRGDGNSRR